MSDIEILYDLRLEDMLEKIKLRIWLNEELQLQPKAQRSDIAHLYLNDLEDIA